MSKKTHNQFKQLATKGCRFESL